MFVGLFPIGGTLEVYMARISRRLSIALGIMLGAIVGLPAVASADIWVVTRDTKQVCARVPSDDTVIFFVGEC